MEFRLLGLLEVEDGGGPVRIAPGKESALLALLLIRANQAVPADRIIDEIWGEGQPEMAAKSVHVYVSRLRKTLGADRIETTPGGYRIRVERDELDIERFESLLRGGQLEDGLALWRGDALADFRYEPFAQAEARRLEELRDGAVADLLDARIARGETPVAELETLVVRAPLWERPRGQLMRALYLAGRQADALELYRRTRDLLDEELGVEPGLELQRIERGILNQDPWLGTPALPPSAFRRRPRLLLAFGGATILCAAVAAVVIVLIRGGGSFSTVAANSVAVIDAHDGKIVGQIGVGNRPSRLAVAGNRLWALSAGDSTVSEVDTANDRIVARFGPSVVPADLAATPDAVWVGTAAGGADGGMTGVARFDAARHTLLGASQLARDPGRGGRPPEARAMVATPFGVWAIGGDGVPVGLDVHTGRPTRVARGVVGSALAYGMGRLWALSGTDVVPIDPRTGRAGDPIDISSLFYLGGIAVGGGSVWATSPAEGEVWRIDVNSRRRTSIPVAYGASSVAYADGSVWVGNRYDDSVERIDPSATPPTVTRVATIPAPQDVVGDGHYVYVASGAPAGRAGPVAISSCGPPDVARADVRIVSDLPLSGPFAARSAAAVKTFASIFMRHHHRAGRFRVSFQACDDSTAAAGGYDDGQCEANATAYADDLDVVGVIGPLNSECAQSEIPILNRAPHGPLGLISPFVTGPFLSRPPPGPAVATFRQFYAAGPHNFTRTIGDDHLQVAADALLAHRLHLRRVAVLYDEGPMLDRVEARWFAAKARRLGLEVTPIAIDSTRSGLGKAMTRAHADGAFVTGFTLGSTPAEGAPILAALDTVPGRTVIVTDAFPPAATRGRTARFYATSAVPNARASAVDLLAAIAASNGTRRSVVAHLLGRRGVDRWGDPLTAPVSVIRLPSGAHFATITA
jgi:DNA-binding SARP family transcriptional activator/DNA-binding beta-propeller fold protein YncE